jgi:YHS domain-containing protein
MSLTRLGFFLFGVAIVVSGALYDAGPVAAQDDRGARRLQLLPPIVGTSSETLTHTLSGIALDGFDPVSYFLSNEPSPGRARHETLWKGAAWRFASEANKAAFLAHPDVYAPRLGGYDALAMTEGKAVEGSPRVSAVLGARLYFFTSEHARERFLEDAAAAQRAEAFWLETKAQLARE